MTMPATVSPSVERRQLTVLFCDLVGSTALATRLDPEDLRETIRAYHVACAAEVNRFGGFVARHMGDGVLAYFGYPHAHEDDAERSVRAGLALLEAVGRLSARFDLALQARIGIATGLVVVGDLIGEGAAQEYAALGETPNLAARLQVFATPNAIVISSATRRLTGGLFEYRDLGSVVLKGFDGPMRVWQVIGTSSVQSRFEALRDARLTPLVGRNEEMAELLSRWRQAEQGNGQVVVLVGEPGIGKSRIAREFEERLGGEAHESLLFFCSPHHQGSALFPIIRHLEGAADLARVDSVEQKLGKLEALFARVPTEPESMGLIAELLALPAGAYYPMPQLSPQRRKERLLEALWAHVAGLAEQQPVLLLFEDVHWIDPTSLELLRLTVEKLARLRVMVIVTARSPFAASWPDCPHVTMVSLTRLNHRDGRALVDGVTAGKELPRQVMEQILARTDGVPLFIEELTKMVLESGLLREVDGGYALCGPLPGLAIPTTLHDSLTARLDRRASVRAVAQAGAAIGREFSYVLLSAVAGLPADELKVALDELVRSDLVLPRDGAPQMMYSFKHALVRDAAYDALVRGHRRDLHTRIASVLEERFPEVVERQPELLAQHCMRAGLNERAVAYWSQAGRKSFVRSTMAEAISQFKQGLDLLPSLPDTPRRRQQELDLQASVGAALIATQGFAAAPVEHAYARARELCTQVGDTPQLFPVLWGLWGYYGIRGDAQTTEELAEQLAAVALREQDPVLLVAAQVVLGITSYARGGLVAARARLDEASALYDPRHQHQPLVHRFGYDEGLVGVVFRSHTLWHLGYPDQALQAIREAVSLAQDLSHPLTEANVLHFSAWLRVYRREVLPAQGQSEAQLSLSAERGFPFFVAHATVFRGWALVQQGHETEGIELIHQGLEGYRATGARSERSYLLGLLSDAYKRIGEKAQGLRAVAEALADLHKHGWSLFEADLYRLKGELLLLQVRQDSSRTSDLDEAEECFRHALEVARGQHAKSLELRAAVSLSRLWQRQSKRVAARELLANVYGWFTEGFDTPDLREAGMFLDELTA